ncbi:MAG: FHIPEP family type III secretion protein [Myxococcales bacterium]|nr:FHIPEP family type III secretion protein [Myxococcales bacterium]
MNLISRILLRAKSSSDVVLAVVMAAILGAMVVPLPTWALDAGIALNLAAAAALLVAALYAREALQVAVFPTLLLLTTLFRLALNVSSTRLALSEGHAGEIIQAFGEFVVRGDYVVGAVVFAILTLVQFIVVAKGAERVAEVSARFTLDAMPGKQMSIDADLRSGAIDQAQARRRRRELERESQLFGAMDGAMKFVKGDVIAGLIIVLVNLLGGAAVGVLSQGMELSEAASTYALIAIGDGLVSQIPSLSIAVAAGLLVTRVSSEGDEASLGADIASQLFGHWKALVVVSGLCLALAAVPGMPTFTFAVVAFLAGGAAFFLRKSRSAAPAEPPTEAQPDGEPKELPVGVSPLTLDLSPDLSPLAEEDGQRFARVDLEKLREQLFAELGVRSPGIRIRVGAAYLAPGTYALLLDEVPCGRGQVAPGALYATAPASELSFLGIPPEPAVDPGTGKAISRVPPEARSTLEAAQVPLRTSSELICDHLLSMVRKQASNLIGVQDVQALLDAFEPHAPALVKEALNKVPLPLLTDVLRKLVQEEVSIRDLRAILEALVSPTAEGDASALAERCRQALRRYLSHKHAPTGPLYAYLVDPAIEEDLRAHGASAALEPERVGAILQAVHRIAAGGKAVLLCAPDVRRSLRKLLEGAFPGVSVLTYGELDPELQIRPVGRLSAQA